MTIHHRREIEHAPMAIRELLKLGIREAVHVSELLEIPTLVASTDLVGVFAGKHGSTYGAAAGTAGFAASARTASTADLHDLA